jgi:hypothetical protein
MTGRAFSLLRTMLHPVLSTLPFGAGRERSRLPVGPHHAVPAINLGGVILERSAVSDVALAEAMYRGSFDFAGEHVSSLPDAVFSRAAPSNAWRVELLRFDWLASFRASPKSLHGLFALRLLSAWVSARPHYGSSQNQIAALYNLAVDAPAIAATQSPAAIAIATAAILQAQQPVQRLKPDAADVALTRNMALLAAHLATKRPDSQRSRLVQDLADSLQHAVGADGSHLTAGTAELHVLQERLATLMRGLAVAGEQVHLRLAEVSSRIHSYLTLLARPDRSLAFVDGPALMLAADAPVRHGTALADTAGHARLSGGKTLLLANFGIVRESRSLQLEIHDGEQPLLWLQQAAHPGMGKREDCTLICAAGGSLLEIHSRSSDEARQHLAIFLSGDGSDIRLEEKATDGVAPAYFLHVPDQARLSTTHGGAGAMILQNASSAWQLLVRGGHVELENGMLRVTPGGPADSPLNFALKRVSPAGRPARNSKAVRVATERAKADQSPRLL